MHQIFTRYLLQLSFFLSSFGAFAQVGNEKWSIADRLAPEWIPGVSEASQPRIGFTDPAQQKTTSVGSRLISTFWEVNTWGSGQMNPHDTTSYVYSGGRGGDLSPFHPLQYDTQHVVKWDPGTGFMETERRFCTYNASGSKTSEIVQYFYTGQWENRYRTFWAYGRDGMDSMNTMQEWDNINAAWVNSLRGVRHYNNKGLLFLSESDVWNAAQNVFVPRQRDSIVYNSQAQVIYRQLDQPDTVDGPPLPATLMFYSYNAAGLLLQELRLDKHSTSSLPDSDRTTTYYYDTSDRMIAKATHAIGNGVYTDDSTSVTTFTLSGLPSIAETYVSRFGSWQRSTRHSDIYDGNDLLIGGLEEQYGGYWMSVARYDFSYNNAQQLTQRESYSFNNGWKPWYKQYYRYESYNYTAGIPSTNKDAEISLSPIPADQTLHIRFSLQKAQQVQWRIMDMRGIQAAAWTVGNSSTAVINTAQLPVGSYCIQLTGAEGARASRIFSIVH